MAILESELIRSVENESYDKQLVACRRVINSLEKGDSEPTQRLCKNIRRLLRKVQKSSKSAEERLEAAGFLDRLKKLSADDDEAPAETPTTNQSPTDPDRQSSVDAHDCLRAQTNILGHSWGHQMPLKRSDREALLAELLPDVTVPAVQRLILDMRRPDERGCRLSSFVEIFNGAQQYLVDQGAEELPREPAELENERLNSVSFEERMRERGAEGY